MWITSRRSGSIKSSASMWRERVAATHSAMDNTSTRSSWRAFGPDGACSNDASIGQAGRHFQLRRPAGSLPGLTGQSGMPGQWLVNRAVEPAGNTVVGISLIVNAPAAEQNYPNQDITRDGTAHASPRSH